MCKYATRLITIENRSHTQTTCLRVKLRTASQLLFAWMKHETATKAITKALWIHSYPGELKHHQNKMQVAMIAIHPSQMKTWLQMFSHRACPPTRACAAALAPPARMCGAIQRPKPTLARPARVPHATLPTYVRPRTKRNTTISTKDVAGSILISVFCQAIISKKLL